MTHEISQLMISNVLACVAVITFFFKVNSSWKKEKPRLSVSATLAEISGHPEVLWIVCENEGKRPIFCVSFIFITNRFFKNSKRIILNSQYKIPDSVTLPHRLLPDNCISQHFKEEFFNLFNENLNLLGNNKWWAKIKLRFFWRVTVETVAGEFEGRLSKKLIHKILSSLFAEEIGGDQELSMEYQ